MNTARRSSDGIRPTQATFAGTVSFNDPASDQALVATAKMGHQEAFETLVKRYRPRIFALALRYTRVREDAEDVVQQTFQKTFVYLGNFEGKSSFSTWLTRIAINQALMFLRRARAQREVAIDDSCSDERTGPHFDIHDERPDPEIAYLKREEAEILSTAIRRLTPRIRRVLELKDLRELSAQETARQTGLSVSAVKARVFHGRKKLRRTLQGLEITRRRLQGSAVTRGANRTLSEIAVTGAVNWSRRLNKRRIPMCKKSRNRKARFGPALVLAFVACSVMYAQDVRTNYMPGIDFSKYHTYLWVDEIMGVPRVSGQRDQILDTQVKQAVDCQMAAKGLTKVVDGDKADLLLGYQVAIDREKQINGFANGWGGWGPWGGGLDSFSATSSTINIGTFVLGMYDPAAKKLIWIGAAQHAIEPSKKQEKNQERLNKGAQKLLKDFPPGRGK